MQVLQKIEIPVLTYHSIDNSGSIISTAPAIFEQQMKFLSEAGYCVFSLEKVVSFLSENKLLPSKTAVLTFDDGFQNFFTTAFPILDLYGFKATVFLVTDFCGKYTNWEGNPPDFPLSKALSWKEIKELNNFGIRFGSHTMTHPDLTQMTFEKFEKELFESKAIIEDTLGVEVTTFAYPFGKFNSSVRQVTEKTYKAACSTNLGKVKADSDYFSLERIDTYYLSNPKIFSLLSTNAFDRYLALRQFMRNIKAKTSNNKLRFVFKKTGIKTI